VDPLSHAINIQIFIDVPSFSLGVATYHFYLCGVPKEKVYKNTLNILEKSKQNI